MIENFSASNKSMIKQANTSLILRIIRSQEPISRAEISKITGLNPATVSSNLIELLQSGLVRETGSGESSGGRKPTLLELNSDRFAVIAVDMGTSHIHTAVVNLNGKVVTHLTLPLMKPYSVESVLETMLEAIRTMQASVQHRRILGIGIGAHGLVNSDNGISIYAPAYQWKDVEIGTIIEQSFHMPVRIDNDVRAMALAEKWFGKAKELSHFMFLNIGTGIGSGIYMNGELISGARFGAGEIGHIHVVDHHEGERCFCGKYGCLSTVASGPALEKRFQSKLTAGAPSILQGKEDAISGQQIYQAALQGDALSLRLLRETGEIIGHALSIAVNMLNPEKIIIGGGLSRAEQFLFPPMRKMIEERAMRNNTEHLVVERTALGDNSGIVGAATLILKDVFYHPEQFIQKEK